MAPTQYPSQGPASFPPLSGAQIPSQPLLQPPSSASSTLIHRTQKWIEENQRLLILGATLAVVGGAGYLLYNRPPAPRSGGGDSEKAGSGEGSTTAASKKNKKKKGKKSTGSTGLRGEGEDEPLLEEITKKEEVGKKEGEKEKVVETAPDHLEGEFLTSLLCLLGISCGRRRDFLFASPSHDVPDHHIRHIILCRL